jgi:phosphoesterase RecJ-like protein
MDRLERIKNIINDGTRFLITTHIDPDGDAVGSALALSWVLDGMGKEQVVYLKDQIPYRYQFLPKLETVTRDFPSRVFDAAFVLDCGSLHRVGEDYEKLLDGLPLINIDHHLTNDLFGNINLVDSEASSTGEILYRIFNNLSVPPTLNTGINLYTAILTDTGGFRYENTTRQAFAVCEELMEVGIDPSYVAGMVYENHPLERFYLFRDVLSTLQSFQGGRVILAFVTQEMFARTHTTREHSDGFVEELKQIRGTDVVMLAREINSGKYKISMRSKGTVNVASICNLFGGGGHQNAAGCTIEGNREGVIIKLKEALAIS